MSTKRKTEEIQNIPTNESYSDGSASAFSETEGLNSGKDKETSDVQLDQWLSNTVSNAENRNQACADTVY